jgi:CDP-diacylglycerol---serine O-phosphatidyltransferase
MNLNWARYLAPNALSAANIACGFAAVAVASDERFDAAVYLLVLAIVLDSFDGAVARWLAATSRFGQEMDSFSDALSFGAAPAYLLYFAFLRPLGGWGLVVCLAYLLAAILRLARFNLTSDAHVKDSRTVGLPTPIAASYVMAAVLMRRDLEPGVMVVVGLLCAGLMLSRIQLPNLKGRTLTTGMLLVGCANYLLVVFAPSWYAIGWWNAWNVAILVAAHAQERRLEVGSSASEYRVGQ